MILAMGSSRRHRRVEVRPMGRPPLECGTPVGSSQPTSASLAFHPLDGLISYMESPQNIEQGVEMVLECLSSRR